MVRNSPLDHYANEVVTTIDLQNFLLHFATAAGVYAIVLFFLDCEDFVVGTDRDISMFFPRKLLRSTTH